jgi:hypothetical protein
VANPTNDPWTQARNAFADQFEQFGNGLVYRRSQKGQAISVTVAERRKLTEDFDRRLRRANWIIYIGLTLVLGGVIGFSLIRDSDLSQAAVFIGIATVMIPYFAYYRWAWGAPARELAGRTPVAGERAPQEVRQLQFQRITYGQLATAAVAGLAIPFIGNSRQDIFSGWNRLWLVIGGALIVFAAVQAFRKWRYEQDDSRRIFIPSSLKSDATSSVDDAAPSLSKRLRTYVPLALVLLGFAFIAYTAAGKELARQPGFWSVLMVGLAGWCVFTVARGFATGQIEPLARGFYNSYERETQPKRFWLSMAWNTVFACLCIWVAIGSYRQAVAERIEDQCYEREGVQSAQEVLSACNSLIASQPDEMDPYLYRGLMFLDMMKLEPAIADFTRAHELDQRSPWPLANRGLSYAWNKEEERARDDFRAVQAIDPANPVMLRGEAILRMNAGDTRGAVDRLTTSMKRDPDNLWAIRKRAELYWDLGEVEKSREDDSRWRELNAMARRKAE